MWHGHRRIGITSSALGQLDRVWLNNNLSLAKICVNTTLVLYGCGPRTILKEVNRRLEAFHVRCQRRIIGIKWSDFTTYDYASSRLTTGLRDICDTMVPLAHSFGHSRHLAEDTSEKAGSHQTMRRYPLRKEASSWLKASTLSPVDP